jgi:hypothetical protein
MMYLVSDGDEGLLSAAWRALVRGQIPRRIWLMGLGFWVGTVLLSHFWTHEPWVIGIVRWAIVAVMWTAVMAAWTARRGT